MLEIILVPGVMVLLIIVVLILLLFKRLFKAFVIVLFVLFIVFAGCVIVIAKDIVNIKYHMEKGNKVFVYDDGGFVLGVDFESMETDDEENDLDIQPLGKEKLDKLQTIYEEGKESKIGMRPYFMILAHKSFFRKYLPDTVKLDIGDEEEDMFELKKEYSKEFMLNFVKSEDCVDMLLKENFGVDIPEPIKNKFYEEADCSELKPMFFMIMMQNVIGDEKEGNFFPKLLKGLKNDDLGIYPEFLIYRIAKALPYSTMEGIAEKIVLDN